MLEASPRGAGAAVALDLGTTGLTRAPSRPRTTPLSFPARCPASSNDRPSPRHTGGVHAPRSFPAFPEDGICICPSRTLEPNTHARRGAAATAPSHPALSLCSPFLSLVLDRHASSHAAGVACPRRRSRCTVGKRATHHEQDSPAADRHRSLPCRAYARYHPVEQEREREHTRTRTCQPVQVARFAHAVGELPGRARIAIRARGAYPGLDSNRFCRRWQA